MKQFTMKTYQTLFVLRGIFIILLLIAFILLVSWKPLSNWLELLILGIYIVFNGFLLKALCRDMRACRVSKGNILKKPPIKLETIALCMSILGLLYVINTIAERTYDIIDLILIILLSNTSLIYHDYIMIIVEDNQLYFRKCWIPYSELREIECDCSVKNRVTVYVMGKKTISQRFKKEDFEQFKESLCAVGHKDKFGKV
ncbi:MAG: hypothetical protein RR531_03540 [Longicatena sp.]